MGGLRPRHGKAGRYRSRQLESIADQIEKVIQDSGDREVNTRRDQQDHHRRRLKALDKVAYVRFASVYLEFEVLEFMTELKDLVQSRHAAPKKKKSRR